MSCFASGSSKMSHCNYASFSPPLELSWAWLQSRADYSCNFPFLKTMHTQHWSHQAQNYPWLWVNADISVQNPPELMGNQELAQEEYQLQEISWVRSCTDSFKNIFVCQGARDISQPKWQPTAWVWMFRAKFHWHGLGMKRNCTMEGSFDHLPG